MEIRVITVEIFKTNVQQRRLAEAVLEKLRARFPEHWFNFDLEDCDRILRVEGEEIDAVLVIALLQAMQLQCSLL